MPLRRTLSLVLVCALGATAFAALVVGDEAPDVAVTMCDGKDAKLSAHEGRAVVLFFYGTWQKKAGEDAVKVDGLRKGREKQKLDVIGIARDAKIEDAKKFGEEQKLGFPQACDPKGDFYKRFSEKGLPWVVVLDGKRKVKYTAGGVDATAIDAALTEILGKAEKEEKPKDDKPKDEKPRDEKKDDKPKDEKPK